jgi:hypothetical protein
MILHQTIGSARAEKNKKRHARAIIQNLMTALLASALTLPSLAAWGAENSPVQAATRTGGALQLPPIPYLDSMPWMKSNASAPALRIDTLMSPTVTPWGILETPQDGTKALPAFS